MNATGTGSRMRTSRLLNTHHGRVLEFQWPLHVAQWMSVLTGCSKRPQRVKALNVPDGYVESLNDARTMLTDFFSRTIEE